MESFYDLTLQTAALQSAVSKFDHCCKMVEEGSKPRCILLTGPAGTGKTEILEYYKSINPTIKQGHIYHVPVLLTRISERPTIAETAFQMLNNLGQEASYTIKNERSLVLMLKGLLKKCGTKIILIDEFQELIEFKLGKEILVIATWLKHLSTEVNIPIVLTGMCWSKRILEETQWASRVMYRINIKPLNIESYEDAYEYKMILKGISKRLPFKEKTPLESDEYALPLIAVTDGIFRMLKWLIEDAVVIAQRENAVYLAKIHLIEALKNHDNLSVEYLAIFEYPVEVVEQYLDYIKDKKNNDATTILKAEYKRSLALLPQILSKK